MDMYKIVMKDQCLEVEYLEYAYKMVVLTLPSATDTHKILFEIVSYIMKDEKQ